MLWSRRLGVVCGDGLHSDRAGISERMSDYITGHKHKSEGAKYGAPTLEDMAAALEKFPRYEIRPSNDGGL